MIAPKPGRMSSREYIEWAMAQPRGRYELVEGVVVGMPPERVAHARAKLRIARLLEDAIQRAGVPCEAFGDGIAVEIDQSTVYEPDAMVRCGRPMAGDAVLATDPVIIVEGLSPSTRAVDSNIKLEQYFRISSAALPYRADQQPCHHTPPAECFRQNRSWAGARRGTAA